MIIIMNGCFIEVTKKEYEEMKKNNKNVKIISEEDIKITEEKALQLRKEFLSSAYDLTDEEKEYFSRLDPWKGVIE